MKGKKGSQKQVTEHLKKKEKKKTDKKETHGRNQNQIW
jgi:hypothetical protein